MPFVRTPALCLVMNGRAQPCPQCELESQYRAIRVMPSLCEMREQVVRCVLAEVQSSLGARQATSELEWRVLVCMPRELSMSCVAGVIRDS